MTSLSNICCWVRTTVCNPPLCRIREMNRDVAGLEEDDDGKEVEEKDRALGWRAAVGWEERRSRINLSATVPCPRRFLSPIACLLTLIEYPARPPAAVDGSSVLIWLIALALHLCPQTIKNSAFKTLSVNRQIQNASSEKREILCSTSCKLGADGMTGKDDPKYWERSLSQCHFLHHKFHMRDRTVVSMARSQRQITSANGKVCYYYYYYHHHHHYHHHRIA